MPCKSDHLNATSKEKYLSQVACLLDELNGVPINKAYWDGYHPAIYNRHVDADEWVSKLCSALQHIDVSKYSLEMQIWWRDHQEADRLRLIDEQKKLKQAEDRKTALAKLTDYEKKLLGVK